MIKYGTYNGYGITEGPDLFGLIQSLTTGSTVEFVVGEWLARHGLCSKQQSPRRAFSASLRSLDAHCACSCTQSPCRLGGARSPKLAHTKRRACNVTYVPRAGNKTNKVFYLLSAHRGLAPKKALT